MKEIDEMSLELIGFLQTQKPESKAFMLLQAILKNQGEESHLTYSEIYDSFRKAMHDTEVSKAWVHRLLKSLIDNKIVETEGKNRYTCNIGTLTAGLSFLKEKKLEDIEREFAALSSEKKAVEAVNTSELAKSLFESATGIAKIPASRFLKGLEEFQRVTNETIYSVAKKGDIIRTSLTGTERFASVPFIDSSAARVQRIVVAAKKGVDVRYSIPPVDLGNLDELWKRKENIELFSNMLELLAEDEGDGPGLHLRFNPAGQKGHQFVSLNSDVITMWISEYPPTAAWITREFNADLIDDIINTFDEQWKRATSIRDHLKQVMAKMEQK